MADEINTQPEPESLAWHQAMRLAIFRPSVRSFERIANDPNASFQRSVFLFVTSAVISFAIQSFALLILIAEFPRHIFWFSVMFAAIFSFLGFVLWVLLTHVIARNQTNDGSGQIRSVAACFANSAAPLLFLVPWLAGIPVVGVVLPIGLIIYQFILAVIAIQAVYPLSIGRALLAGMVMLIAALISVGMHVASILYFIAPIISAYSQQ